MSYSKESRTSKNGAKSGPNLAMLGMVVAMVFAVAFAGFIGYIYGTKQTERLYKNYRLVYTDLIQKYSSKYDLDPYLVAAVIDAESDNDHKAVSYMDARGLLQIMPETGEWIAEKFGEEYSLEKLFDPETNIKYACWYLNFIQERMPNRNAVLASYNTGHNRVGTWLKDEEISSDGVSLDAIPNIDVENYLKKVNEAYDIYKKLYPGALE